MITTEIYTFLTERAILYFMIILSLFLLRFKYIYLITFIIGYSINIFINYILKGIIKDSRPVPNKKLLEIAIANHYRIADNQYGMPSSHAQQCGFCLVFLTLVTNSPLIFSLYAVVSVFIIAQRICSKAHSFMQIFVGFLLGCIIGYGTWYYAHTQLKGLIKEKKDNNVFYFLGI